MKNGVIRFQSTDASLLGCFHDVFVSLFTSLWQIVCTLEQDDTARKQRLAFKLEQVVAFMSLES